LFDTPHWYSENDLPTKRTPLVNPTLQHRSYTVAGMTCDHCVLSVREEVAEIAGVSSVDVELASGRLTVAGYGFSDDAVAAAVAEAGYEVVA
jgi:copper chaperone